MAARLVVKARKFDHVTPILHALHWLPVESRITFKVACLTYKSLHGLSPPYLRDLLKQVKQSRSLRSQNDSILEVPMTKCVTLGDRAFMCAAPKIWNSLPQNIKHSDA